MPFGRLRAVERRLLLEPGELAGGAARHPQVVHQVVAEGAARVAEAARVLRVLRVEQDAGRLERLRREHHGAAADLPRLARDAVDVEQPRRAVRARVRQHLVDHRVRHVRAVAAGERVGHGRERRVEVGVGDAAPVARPAVVAGRAPVERAGDVGHAPDRHGPAELALDALAQPLLAALEGHRRVEAAVGQLVEALGEARDRRRSPRPGRSTARGRRRRAASPRRSRRGRRP